MLRSYFELRPREAVGSRNGGYGGGDPHNPGESGTALALNLRQCVSMFDIFASGWRDAAMFANQCLPCARRRLSTGQVYPFTGNTSCDRHTADRWREEPAPLLAGIPLSIPAKLEEAAPNFCKPRCRTCFTTRCARAVRCRRLACNAVNSAAHLSNPDQATGSDGGDHRIAATTHECWGRWLGSI